MAKPTTESPATTERTDTAPVLVGGCEDASSASSAAAEAAVAVALASGSGFKGVGGEVAGFRDTINGTESLSVSRLVGGGD